MRIEDNKLIAECTVYDFKRELERKRKGSWLKSVSAFANASGGTLFFGVDDDGSVVGVSDAQSDTKLISEAINAYLDPIPVYSLIPEECENGKHILVLTVAAGNQTPYYLNLDGRKLAYVRSGDESIPANSHQLYEKYLHSSHD